jgi:hypothetical protein
MPGSRVRVAVFALFVPALAAAAAAQAPTSAIAEVTEARLQAAYADAQAACAKALGGPLEPAVPLRLAKTSEIAAIIARENLPLVRLRQPDPAKAEAEAEQLGTQIGSMMYAKYSWADRAFYVVAPTWRKLAEMLEEPTLTADVGLRAVMVHELCHAYDDRKFDLTSRLTRCTTTEAATAFNAVLEGHAQLQARRVCGRNGWMDGFTAMRDAVAKVPASVGKSGEAALLLARAGAASMAFAYHDGEAFVTAVLAADPARGAERVFTAPPIDQDTVLHPQWYLDPATRPATLYDAEPALARLEQWLGEEWRATRMDLTGKQIAAGLTLLPPADVEAFTASVRAGRAVQAVPLDRPQSKSVIVAVIEFDSAASAQRWIELAAELGRRKDETMKTGSVRILGGTATPLAEDGLVGHMQRKSMRAGFAKLELATIDAVRDRIVVETVFSGAPPDDDAHKHLVRELLDAVAKKPAKPADAAKSPPK